MTEQPRKNIKLVKHLAVDQPPPFAPVIAAGMRALQHGTATDHQQRTVFEWIVKDLCGIGAQSFRAGDPYATAFMDGRRFVGIVMINLANEKVSEI